MTNDQPISAYVLCIDDGGYPESLEVRKVYSVLADESAASCPVKPLAACQRADILKVHSELVVLTDRYTSTGMPVGFFYTPA